jgi:hypothetical protein
MKIRLEDGDLGTYLLVLVDEDGVDTGKDRLIQSDTDRPGVARTFGWNGEDTDIDGATEFLDENIGKTADDPGYFD